MVSSTTQSRSMWKPVKNMKLRRILGSTISGRFSLIQHPKTNNLIYIAGCIVVILDTDVKSQRHLFTSSKQPLTTLAITNDGLFLAAASCSSKQASIYIWDIQKQVLISEWKTNNFTIACMTFSNNGKTLVLAGDQRDPTLTLWDWRRQHKLSSNPVDTKIRAIAFAQDDRYFITVGHAHVMYWQVMLPSNSNTTALVTCEGSANLGEHKKNSFCDVKCGKGSMSNSFYCITNTGLLCEINSSRLLHKWVDLRVASANCLAVSDDLIAIGCSNGVVRCFNSKQLRFLRNMPRPFNSDHQHHHNRSTSGAQQAPKSTYSEVSSIVLNDTNDYLTCQYADKCIYVWDLNETPSNKSVKHSGLYHSSCIWGLDMYPASPQSTNKCLPEHSFITCSSDDSVRIWNPNLFESKTPIGNHNRLHPKGLSSHELLQVIFTHDDLISKTTTESSNIDSSKINDSYDNNYGLRCLRVAPDGRQVAIGSRSGVIKIYNLERDQEVKNIAAHDAEVLCLEYSDLKGVYSAHLYLASSSRDKLIHIFDASDNYNFLQTIDDHSSSITALKFFTSSKSHNCLQLISCGADFKIIIRNGLLVNGQLNFTKSHQIEGKSTFYDMVMVKDSSYIITGCQDSMVRLYDVARAEYLTSFQGLGSETGAIIKLALDPSSTFLATSYTDKSIRIYDYQKALCIASIDVGLSDLVTDMKFTHDGRFFVACSGDGCIFIWELPVQIYSAITSKMSALTMDQLVKEKNVILTSKSSAHSSITNHSSDYEIPQFTMGSNKSRSSDQESGHYNENLYAEINQPDKSYQVHNVNMLENDYMNSKFSSSIDLNGRTLPCLGSRYNSRDDGSARLFQQKSEMLKSRDSLDLITRRQRYVSDNLMHAQKATTDTNGSRTKKAHPPNHYQSLRSARSYVSQSNDDFRNMTFSDQTRQTSNYSSPLGSRLVAGEGTGSGGGRVKTQAARQLERMATSGMSQSMNLMDMGRVESQQVLSTDDEEDCSSDYDNNRLLVNASNSRQRSVTPPKPSQHRQFRRNSGNNTGSSIRNDASPHSHTSILPVNEANKNNNSTLLLTGEQKQPTKGDFEHVGRINMHQLEAGDDLSMEQCRSVAQELQAISKYVSELHRMLVSNEASQPLQDVIETAAQSSIALLSGILLNDSIHQQEDGHEEEGWIPIAKREMLVQQNQLLKHRRHGSRHQLMVSPPPQQYESVIYGKKTTNQQQQRTGEEVNEAVQLAAGEELGGPPEVGAKTSGESGARVANLDKVLEAYSDRLFKMVQERMVESAAVRGGPTSSGDAREFVSNNERLGQ